MEESDAAYLEVSSNAAAAAYLEVSPVRVIYVSSAGPPVVNQYIVRARGLPPVVVYPWEGTWRMSSECQSPPSAPSTTPSTRWPLTPQQAEDFRQLFAIQERLKALPEAPPPSPTFQPSGTPWENIV